MSELALEREDSELSEEAAMIERELMKMQARILRNISDTSERASENVSILLENFNDRLRLIEERAKVYNCDVHACIDAAQEKIHHLETSKVLEIHTNVGKTVQSIRRTFMNTSLSLSEEADRVRDLEKIDKSATTIHENYQRKVDQYQRHIKKTYNQAKLDARSLQDIALQDISIILSDVQDLIEESVETVQKCVNEVTNDIDITLEIMDENSTKQSRRTLKRLKDEENMSKSSLVREKSKSKLASASKESKDGTPGPSKSDRKFRLSD